MKSTHLLPDVCKLETDIFLWLVVCFKSSVQLLQDYNTDIIFKQEEEKRTEFFLFWVNLSSSVTLIDAADSNSAFNRVYHSY